MLNYDECWRAVESRDPRQDGRFYFGVLTTGVYCRPSCAARRPLRKNVRFYATPAEAERDGLRPCKRCRPAETADPAGERMRELCRYIEEHSEEPLRLNELAQRASMSPFHLQRKFKAIVGVSPKQFQDAARTKRLKSGLRKTKEVTAAVYDAGYGSSSRVYERVDTHLGMTPSQYRDGGKGVNISYATMPSTMGLIMIGATDRGICFLQFGDEREQLVRMLKQEYPQARITPMAKPAHPEFARWTEAVNRYLAGTRSHLKLPLDLRASAFQIRVWNYLQSIPYGDVQSYGEVAAALGSRQNARAVARACASNRVALVIPCHRVVRGTGALGGYRWGLARKRALIDRERAGRRR